LAKRQNSTRTRSNRPAEPPTAPTSENVSKRDLSNRAQESPLPATGTSNFRNNYIHL